MQFNPDPKIQAQDVAFSKKSKNTSSLPLRARPNKHLELILDERRSFTGHIDSKISKCYKLIKNYQKIVY